MLLPFTTADTCGTVEDAFRIVRFFNRQETVVVDAIKVLLIVRVKAVGLTSNS
jgi:hypothetical protein